jgi:hypothetical protein
MEKLRTKSGKNKEEEAKRKRDAVDIVLLCKEAAWDYFEDVIHSLWIRYTHSVAVVYMTACRTAEDVDATNDIVRSTVLRTAQSKAR